MLNNLTKEELYDALRKLTPVDWDEFEREWELFQAMKHARRAC